MDVRQSWKRPRLRRPSPALVVATIALVVACAGTATAARVLIKSSAQVRFGSLNGTDVQNESLKGADVKDGSLTGRDLRRGSLGSSALSNDARDALRGGGGGGASAIEVFRKRGPESQPGGTDARVATMSGVEPGIYAIFAKTILTSLPSGSEDLLGELLSDDKTGGGRCVLNAAGDQDHSREAIATPYSSAPATFDLQITRTFASPVEVTLDCGANVPWRASDTSLIAIRLSRAPRVEVGG